MKVDTESIGHSSVWLVDGERYDTDVAESERRMISGTAVKIDKSTHHTNILSWANGIILRSSLIRSPPRAMYKKLWTFVIEGDRHDTNVEPRVKLPLL
jgi:hypothetical protein